MEIKYDASGQPLPESQQDWAKKPVEAQPQQQEAPVNEEPADVQLANPFVQEYLASQKKPAEQPQEVEAAPELPLESFEEEKPKKQDHPNFRALRLAAEKAERERDELARLLRDRELREAQQLRPTQQDEVDDLDIPDDGFVEPKHIKKLYKELKETRRAHTEYKQKTAKEMQEMMLYKQYPDIEQVVSPENIEILKDMKPAYARQLAALHQAGDVYGVGELAYNYITDLGIYKKQTTPTKDYTAEKIKIQNNLAKPRPGISTTTGNKADSPMARAHAFSGELNDNDMKRHYQEMEAAIRNRGD